jgi:superfamily II DNA helicase RecQ
MHIRVVTLSFHESLSGFAEEPLKQACTQGNLLEVREHFYVHAGIPRLTLVLTFDDSQPPLSGRNPSAPDSGEALPEALRPLYKQLRQWRNERAQRDGVPSYVILRNAQLAEICRRQPRAAARDETAGHGDCPGRGQAAVAGVSGFSGPAAPPWLALTASAPSATAAGSAVSRW